MKNTSLFKTLLLLPVVLGAFSCSAIDSIESLQNDIQGIKAQEKDATLTDEQAQLIQDFAGGKYKIESTITTNYVTGTYNEIDELSSEARVSTFSQNGKILDQAYYFDNNGKAYEQYLTVSNEVAEKVLYGSDGNTELSYSAFSGTPFHFLTKDAFTGSSSIVYYTRYLNELFDAKSVGEKTILYLTEYGEGKLTSSLTTFFTSKDPFNWDSTSLKETIADFALTLGSDGNPEALSFTRVKQDKFGATTESYDCTLTILDEISSLTPIEGTMDEADATVLRNALDTFQTSLNDGNFTQTTSVANGSYYYHSYYDLNPSLGSKTRLMISDFDDLYDTTYGHTYMGVQYNSSEGEYQIIGISPSVEYSAQANDTTFTTITEVVPQIGDLSTDFFTVQENDGVKSYVFELKDKVYNDYYFSSSVLDCVFGPADYLAAFGGLYVGTDNSNYDFDTLTLTINEDGTVSSTLVFENSYGTYNAEVSYSDIGTTNLLEAGDLMKQLVAVVQANDTSSSY